MPAPTPYVGYQTSLENKDDFPAAKSVTWMTEAQGQADQGFRQCWWRFLSHAQFQPHLARLQELPRRDGGAPISAIAAAPVRGACHRQRHPITAGMQTFVVMTSSTMWSTTRIPNT